MLTKLLSKLSHKHPPRCVVSHPKSGRTWLRVMLDELGIDADYTHAGPRRKGYMHYKDLSTQLKRPYERILILTRDPRDAAVSGYHQMTRRSHESHQFSGTMGEFLRDPRVGIEKAAHFNLLWAEFAAGRTDAMLVSYEDLKADTVGTMLSAARFFGSDPTRAEVEAVVERNEFSRMQERERKGEFSKTYGRPLVPRDMSDPTSFKVRRGKVGSYRDELSAEDRAYVDAKLAELDYFGRMERLAPRQATGSPGAAGAAALNV
jgi:hypothetical protein